MRRRAKRHFMRFMERIGPCGLAMLACVLLWVLCGIGTWRGYAGRPSDAPHPLIPAPVRGAVWIATGLFALVGVRWRDMRPICLGLLTLMPTVRVVSYTWSWVMSWGVWSWVSSWPIWQWGPIDRIVPDGDLYRGSPAGWYLAVHPLVMLALVAVGVLTHGSEWEDWWHIRNRRLARADDRRRARTHHRKGREDG